MKKPLKLNPKKKFNYSAMSIALMSACLQSNAQEARSLPEVVVTSTLMEAPLDY